MESGLDNQARVLFRGALAIFVVTIVIGILNGLDIWEPSRQMILTHVHAGTLGWITLAVVAVSLAMFGPGADSRAVQSGSRMGMASLVTVSLYVLAFATTSGILRPVAGTLLLIAIVWLLIWVGGRYRQSEKTTAQLALYLAVVSLTIGAILGVLLGLLIARGSLPGLDADTAARLAGAHPAAMLIGYLILAGVAVSHWALKGGQGRLGRFVAWALFVAGIVANVAFVFNLVIELSPVFSGLQVIAIIAYIIHMWGHLKLSAWRGGGSSNFARVAVVGLVVGIALLVYVVQLFTSGQLDPETGTGPIGVLIAFDHTMFIGVMTNALFAGVASLALVSAATNRMILLAVNTGIVLFLAGLVADSAVLKRIGTPILGVALLYAIVTYWQRLRPAPA
ncbi:MAG TPA: hypothetical protein VJR05_02135 [Acidimicrobiia bacterium]|nr:hypothetical protein [Acidimicrobiia bacterium]